MNINTYIQNRIRLISYRASIALVARCARRVQPLLSMLPDEHLLCVDNAIRFAEEFTLDKRNADKAMAEVAILAFEIGAMFNDPIASAVNAAAAAAGSVCTIANDGIPEINAKYDTIIIPLYHSYNVCEWLSDYAKNDLDNLVSMNLGKPGTLGATLDSSESGPLGSLWPDGEPDWGILMVRNCND